MGLERDLTSLMQNDSSGTSGHRKSGSLGCIDRMKCLPAHSFHEEPFILVVQAKIPFVYTKPTAKLFNRTELCLVEEFLGRFGVYKLDFRFYDQNERFFMKSTDGKTFHIINAN